MLDARLTARDITASDTLGVKEKGQQRTHPPNQKEFSSYFTWPPHDLLA